MPTLKSLEDQGKALLADQKKLVADTRPWPMKKAEFDKRDKDIKAVLDQFTALKSVDGDPFAATYAGPGKYRSLKGIQAGIASQGYLPIEAPQLEISHEDTRELYDAAVSHKSFAVTSKATTSSSVPQSLVTDYKLNPVPFRREPTRVLSLIPTYATEHPSVTWYSTTGTAAAAAVAEGGTKPTSTIAYTANTTSVTKIAHVAEVTDETLSDFPAFIGVLEQDMVDGLILTENAELMSATVTGAHNFPGLLNVSGILTAARTTETYLDAISAALDTLRVGTSFTHPDGIVMNPSTWGLISRSKDSQGRYLLNASPSNDTDPNIWGIPVVITTQMVAGTVLLGDFANSTAAYVRQGITVDVANQGTTQFTNNTTLVRAEERLLLTAPRPTGLLKLTNIS
jgi:HK97 family phage major capsid protein